MATPASVAVSDAGTPSLLARIVSFWIHTLIVYACAVHVSPWLVYHWFGWVAPILQVSINMPATDWYLQHLELATIVPAMVVGYLSPARFFPAAMGGNFGSEHPDSAAVWTWAVPALVLAYKMVRYDATSSSVLYNDSVSAIRYFFDIQKVMPTMKNFPAGDPIRVMQQMFGTAPFYAGIGYSLGALARNHNVLTKLLKFERHEEPSIEPEA